MQCGLGVESKILGNDRLCRSSVNHRFGTNFAGLLVLCCFRLTQGTVLLVVSSKNCPLKVRV